MSEIPDENVPAPIVLAVNFLTIAIFIAFLLHFIRVKERTYTHYFLLILNISDLFYPILNTVTVFNVAYAEKPLNARFFGPLVLSCYSFSMHWSAAFAIYTYLLYKSIEECQKFNYTKFIGTAFGVCLFLSSFFPIIDYFQDWGERMNFKIHGMYSIGYSPKTFFDQLVSFIGLDFVGVVLPISLNVFFFTKLRTLIQASFHFSQAQKNENLAIWWYPFVAMICFIPGVICDIVIGLSGNFYPFWLSVASNLLHRAWAFMNLWVYWKLTSKANSQEDLLDEESPEFSLSKTESFDEWGSKQEGRVTIYARPDLG